MKGYMQAVARGKVLLLNWELDGEMVVARYRRENPIYDPFTLYYQGEKPHLKFMNLARYAKGRNRSERVLEFARTWGLPAAPPVAIEHLLSEARRMYGHMEILDLLGSRTLGRLRTLVKELHEKGLLLEPPGDLTPEFVSLAPFYPHFSMQTLPPEFRERWVNAGGGFEIQEVAPILGWPDFEQMSDDQLVWFAQNCVTLLFYNRLKPTQLTLTWEREGPDGWLVCPDLLTCLYVMLFFDVTKERVLKCRRGNCSRLFFTKRGDRIYCSRYCARAEATRAWRERQGGETEEGQNHVGL